jgi:transcriptional antiterminator NusG
LIITAMAVETINRWYALAVTAGRERKIRERIIDRLERRKAPARGLQIICPEEEVVIISGSERQTKKRLTLPGYLLVSTPSLADQTVATMISVAGVLGFLGGDERPTPLGPGEVDRMLGRDTGRGPLKKALFSVGDRVEITEGPLIGFPAMIISLDEARDKAEVEVEIFGRQTPASVTLHQLRPA